MNEYFFRKDYLRNQHVTPKTFRWLDSAVVAALWFGWLMALAYWGCA